MNRKKSVVQVLMVVLVLSLMAFAVPAAQAATITFTGTELLSRPTSNSVSITVVPDSALTNLTYQYGTTSGTYPNTTTSTTATAATPKTVVISGLTANTKYYYRMRYSTDSGASWTTRTENSFWTARAAGSTFTFDITSDAHVNILMGTAANWTQVMNDVKADSPDFLVDCGDTVAMRSVSAGDTAAAVQAYKDELPYFNLVSGSSSVYLVAGNHEQKEGWHLQGTLSGSLPVIGTNAQKAYFPMPVPNTFYSGDSATYSYLDGDHLREDYYAWTWGDALFVVIDPYWFTTTRPYVSDPGGGETDATGSGDSWDWTLGQTQFNWLKSTLSGSTAKYKFILTHQMTCDANLSGQSDYGHCGANDADETEWGGLNEDGTTSGWATERSGWGSAPTHQLLVDNKVSAVFHGHDHQYAYEKRDGVVYQALPNGSWGSGGTGFGMYTTGSGLTLQTQPNYGHLRVTVAPAQTTVDYFRGGTTSSAYTYTIAPNTTTTGKLGGVNSDGTVNSTDALIILSADVGIDTSSFCPMNCGDVNGDGFVNSTDALIILSYDVGISVPFPVGTGSCPTTVTQPDGCS